MILKIFLVKKASVSIITCKVINNLVFLILKLNAFLNFSWKIHWNYIFLIRQLNSVYRIFLYELPKHSKKKNNNERHTYGDNSCISSHGNRFKSHIINLCSMFRREWIDGHLVINMFSISVITANVEEENIYMIIYKRQKT